ncbi:NADH-quinone oxidoreductase subunit C [Streptomyces chryseus]|uniref:Dehydrogenase n=1 Tax=Streptomyces chryseus TaxID=68186 RepID=A0ABQ3DP46_9ACTN|nr:NADH-quinone oxidoreductase subunit C [Streptomyces chryseus]GHB06966.1 dehydrogenase [Streptomyces chryseus]
MSGTTDATAYDGLPEAVTEIFGEEATAERGYDLLTVDVPTGSWIAALEIARDKLGCTYFDWLSAVDEPGTGFRVCAHVVALEGGTVRRLLLRTTVPHAAPAVPTAVEVYAGAQWHERETHEMFGVEFTGHPHLVPLLLPEGFEGHPLRKDFVLAARVAKAWPGAKEPGESDHGGPKRRQMLPPGVPDPNDWGPQKDQLPPAPARPARTPRAAGAAGAADRPPRRARSVAEGSATQAAATTAAEAAAPSAEATASRPPRRARSVTEGSASQAAEAATPAAEATAPRPPRRTRSASEGSASQAAEGATPATETPAEPAGSAEADAAEVRPAPAAPARSADAPWHHARPAFQDGDEADRPEKAAATRTGASEDTDTDAAAAAEAAAETPRGDAGAAKEPHEVPGKDAAGRDAGQADAAQEPGQDAAGAVGSTDESATDPTDPTDTTDTTRDRGSDDA